MPREKIEALVAADLDEFYVEKIIGHGVGKNPKKLEVSSTLAWLRA